jgi:shikimate dehydrogenase
MSNSQPSSFRLGLTGYPLGHSLSPKIHTAALQAAGLDGDYSLFPISPEDPAGLSALLGRLRSGELTGLNVTIPHKQTVIPLLDELTPSARSIGAVNTIFVKAGKLTGHNTDAPGFLGDLARCFSLTPTPLPLAGEGPGVRAALVLGAGGAARAVVSALLSDGWHVTLAVRPADLAQAQALSKQHSSLLPFYAFPDLSTLDLSALTLIVNATPLGMAPEIETCPWPERLPFPSGAAVYDCVYNPRETLLVRRARAAGLPAATGLGMLVEQAALAFEIWTGYNPPRDVLLQSVEN